MKKKSKEKNDQKSPQKKLIIGLDNGGHLIQCLTKKQRMRTQEN